MLLEWYQATSSHDNGLGGDSQAEVPRMGASLILCLAAAVSAFWGGTMKLLALEWLMKKSEVRKNNISIKGHV